MNTDYSKPDWLNDVAARQVAVHINYILWDCSTEFMATHGLPTDEQVVEWIEILEARPDCAAEFIQLALNDCREYIKPYTPPISSGSGTRSVPVGTVFKVRKVSSKET